MKSNVILEKNERQTCHFAYVSHERHVILHTFPMRDMSFCIRFPWIIVLSGAIPLNACYSCQTWGYLPLSKSAQIWWPAFLISTASWFICLDIHTLGNPFICLHIHLATHSYACISTHLATHSYACIYTPGNIFICLHIHTPLATTSVPLACRQGKHIKQLSIKQGCCVMNSLQAATLQHTAMPN